MRRRLLRRVLPAVLAGTVLGGCGAAAEPAERAELPVAVAEPITPPAADADAVPTPDTPAPTPTPTPAPPADDTAASDAPAAATAEPSPSPDPDVGPTIADAASFIADDLPTGTTGIQHVVVDVDGDTWNEVVATGIRDRRGLLRVAWWTSDGYVVLAEDAAGPGRDVTDLRVADVNDDGHSELLVVVEGDGLRSMALWSVHGRGRMQRLPAVGGCHDGSHVYGVTEARLESRKDGPPAIVASCDDSPLPVADWSEQRWVWRDGAYRWVEPAPLPSPEPDGDDGDDRPGNGNGRGNGNGNGGDRAGS